MNRRYLALAGTTTLSLFSAWGFHNIVVSTTAPVMGLGSLLLICPLAIGIAAFTPVD